ncbi:helix-turn-helix domain-containing protein [Puniceicoccus vermicola]|uniref:Helix-turn-helix domain-containing protein n=1 Tax=Puniceicoccus vermicola TaxID=388746 RepID=A0A7X1AZQ4_9BACT|nr:helix-turn-helix domain-containing protein [Puniceicoccus vermicola]MBC2602907.1 helix-turn-helix domain-containing protein [Puniceicoccus vermicola]
MINERTEFALRSLQEGVNFLELCREYGISRPTGYKWKARYLRDGGKGMEDRSKRPSSCPNELQERVILRINRLHEKHRHWGPKKIHELYRRSYGEVASLSSFKRVF